jgi:hypothetical protein
MKTRYSALIILSLLFSALFCSAQNAKPGEVSNPEMKRIFDEDQSAREKSNIDWSVVAPADATRRESTRKLIANGELHTGEDFERAAFVFQHGENPDDYLFAHILASIAVAKGKESALWISSATLDRYLQKIGRSQIFGTQYMRTSSNPWTQEPYDRNLISDALRKEMGVPSQAKQAEKLEHLESATKKAK